MNSLERKVLFSPSLMCMDFMKMREQLTVLNERADLYHVDIMDGDYVKNFALSPDFIKQIRRDAKLPIDVHLMVNHPENFYEALAEAGADYISPHSELIYKNAFRTMNTIHSLGCKAGIAINPACSLDQFRYYADLLDKITVMTVDPGFAGQKFIPAMLNKIRELVRFREENGLHYLVEVDGSCNKSTFRQLYDAGVDVMIIGSSGLFSQDPDVSVAWDKMMDIYNQSICCTVAG